MLSGELGMSQAFVARWYVAGGYMDVSEVVVFMVSLVSLDRLRILFLDVSLPQS